MQMKWLIAILIVQVNVAIAQVIPGSFACAPGECLSFSSGQQYYHVLYVTATCEQGRNLNVSAFVRAGIPAPCTLTVYSMISGTTIVGTIFGGETEIGVQAEASAGFAPPFPITFRNFQYCNSDSTISVGGGNFPC